MKDIISESYITRCQKALKAWGAPLSDWYCIEVIDIADDDGEVTEFAVCELCGCRKVRYIHVMHHDEYFENVNVGCICAGIMEGDIIAAKERERHMKNRAKRKRNFPYRKWREIRNGIYHLTYKGKHVYINRSRYNQNRYGVQCCGRSVWSYKNRPIDNFLSAAYAAFDLADPIEEVMRDD
ncbi:MAG: hypothetical protein LIO95_05105 [Clostridiales bacterium]|nr:hypothetical protein [Clostridiales bacterium]